MSKLLERLTRQLAAKGNKDAKGLASSLLVKRGQMKSSGTLTELGKKREALGSAGRAIDRAISYSNTPHQKEDYTYNKKTNAAKLKK